jgi:tRNA (cmo5U34)-methyltransferase
MQDKVSPAIFNQECASSYDKQRAKLAPMKDALHLLIRTVLCELPANARILCVGVGTGSELIYLAKAFPQWRFTAIEPAAAMLDICRRRTQEEGVAARCTFHEGYLESLPEVDAFDAATCILVSHFLVKPEERRHLFREIAARLRPDAYMVNADLASDMTSSAFKSLLEVWIRAHKYADMPVNRDSFGRNVAVLPPQEIELMISSSGFNAPTLFFQTLLIHAWYSKSAS